MLTWQLSELLKGSQDFTEDFDCTEIIELRFDVLSIDKCHLCGTIDYDGKRGKLDITIDLQTTVLAANTGEAVEYAAKEQLVEVFDSKDEEFIDSGNRKIDLNLFVLTQIDTMIPTHVVDTAKELSSTTGKNWQVIDESEYFQRFEEENQQNSFANLSTLLGEKKSK